MWMKHQIIGGPRGMQGVSSVCEYLNSQSFEVRISTDAVHAGTAGGSVVYFPEWTSRVWQIGHV